MENGKPTNYCRTAVHTFYTDYCHSITTNCLCINVVWVICHMNAIGMTWSSPCHFYSYIYLYLLFWLPYPDNCFFKLLSRFRNLDIFSGVATSRSSGCSRIEFTRYYQGNAEYYPYPNSVFNFQYSISLLSFYIYISVNQYHTGYPL